MGAGEVVVVLKPRRKHSRAEQHLSVHRGCLGALNSPFCVWVQYGGNMLGMDKCYFCGDTQTRTNSAGTTYSTLINENHWTGEQWIRVDHCDSCRVAQRPRKPRQSRQPRPIIATDWNMLVAFSGKGGYS